MTDVDLDDLDRATTALRRGRRDLEGLPAAPRGFDAGEMQGVVAGILRSLVESADLASAAMAFMADATEQSRANYEQAEASASDHVGAPVRELPAL